MPNFIIGPLLKPPYGTVTEGATRHGKPTCPAGLVQRMVRRVLKQRRFGTKGSTPVRPITGRPSLAPPSSARRRTGSPCGSLPGGSPGRRRVYHVPHPYPRGVGRASGPV